MLFAEGRHVGQPWDVALFVGTMCAHVSSLALRSGRVFGGNALMRTSISPSRRPFESRQAAPHCWLHRVCAALPSARATHRPARWWHLATPIVDRAQGFGSSPEHAPTVGGKSDRHTVGAMYSSRSLCQPRSPSFSDDHGAGQTVCSPLAMPTPPPNFNVDVGAKRPRHV